MRLRSYAIGPAEPVLTLEEAKAHLRVDHAGEDALIERCIVGAVSGVAGWLGRALGRQAFVGRLDGSYPCRPIEVSPPPVRAITALRYVDEDGAGQTMPDTDYRIIERGPAPSLISLAHGVSAPSVRCQLNSIAVEFDAGYDDGLPMPDSIRTGLLLMVGHLFENREAVNIGNIVNELPLSVQFFLGQHRVLRV
ncbi:head-tail connector protein [Inquilinus sp.]|jgi:uncharacterized phiE125 gp8 family phage protein|uniref:head-tail connector protein n=1 Tax=Inquilinus sp. TaxID=1932117 RepID=UPI0037844CA0